MSIIVQGVDIYNIYLNVLVYADPHKYDLESAIGIVTAIWELHGVKVTEEDLEEVEGVIEYKQNLNSY